MRIRPKLQAPNSKLQASNSKRQTPSAKLQTPSSKRAVPFSASIKLSSRPSPLGGGRRGPARVGEKYGWLSLASHTMVMSMVYIDFCYSGVVLFCFVFIYFFFCFCFFLSKLRAVFPPTRKRPGIEASGQNSHINSSMCT